jgi:multicomponent Na+:H+ antiporter subunit B
MVSLILSSVARFLLPLMLLFSIFLLFRGHHQPGGGFTGGLIATAAFALYGLAFDAASVRRILRGEPRTLIGIGLLLALASGIISMMAGVTFLKGLWVDVPLGMLGEIHIGTPFLFDVGVFLVVLGTALTILLSLAEGEE